MALCQISLKKALTMTHGSAEQVTSAVTCNIIHTIELAMTQIYFVGFVTEANVDKRHSAGLQYDSKPRRNLKDYSNNCQIHPYLPATSGAIAYTRAARWCSTFTQRSLVREAAKQLIASLFEQQMQFTPSVKQSTISSG